jgi:DNA-binding MarR family transcriptional regulator
MLDTGADGWQSPRRSFGGLLAVSSRLFAREHHARLRAAGMEEIRPGSGNLFEHIGEHGSTVAAMAERAGITPQAMVQVVDYLEERGFVSREADVSDRRAKIVRLTERGRAADRIARDAIAEVEAEWMTVFEADRFALLRELLTALVEALEARELGPTHASGATRAMNLSRRDGPG